MSSWIDTVVIAVIIILGLIIMYRALKEPFDLLFGFIGRGLGAIRDKIVGMHEDSGYEVIRYG